jgi:hypothetical protein
VKPSARAAVLSGNRSHGATATRAEASVEFLIPITLFICVTAVLILRPITRRIGSLLEVMTRERVAMRSDQAADQRVLALVEQLSKRLDMLDERLDFNERLIARRVVEPEAQRQVTRAAY